MCGVVGGALVVGGDRVSADDADVVGGALAHHAEKTAMHSMLSADALVLAKPTLVTQGKLDNNALVFICVSIMLLAAMILFSMIFFQGSRLVERSVLAEADDEVSVFVHSEPLEVGVFGSVTKPKFNLRISGPAVVMKSDGVRHARADYPFENHAQAQVSYMTTGSSVDDVIERVRTRVLSSLSPPLKDLVAFVPELVAATRKAVGVNIGANGAEVEGVVYAYFGVKVSAETYYGWLDTTDYAMVAVEDKIASSKPLGLSFWVGLCNFNNQQTVRVVMFLSDVGLDVVVRLPLEPGSPRMMPGSPRLR